MIFFSLCFLLRAEHYRYRSDFKDLRDFSLQIYPASGLDTDFSVLSGQITDFFSTDRFISITKKSRNLMRIDLKTFTVIPFEKEYFSMKLVFSKTGAEIWNQSCYGSVPPEEILRVIQKKLRSFLDQFYWQYLTVNGLVKHSRHKITDYSRWPSTQIFNPDDYYRDWRDSGEILDLH